jgi:hypothetical protein
VPAVPADADRQQHRLIADHPGLAHALIARIQDQVGIGLFEPPAGELGQLIVELDVDRADRRGREAVPHSSSVIALTLRVDTPCTYISASAATSAFSERW